MKRTKKYTKILQVLTYWLSFMHRRSSCFSWSYFIIFNFSRVLYNIIWLLQKKSFLKFGFIFQTAFPLQRHECVAAEALKWKLYSEPRPNFTCLLLPSSVVLIMPQKMSNTKQLPSYFLKKKKKGFLCFFFLGAGGYGWGLTMDPKTKIKRRQKTKSKTSVFFPGYTENV